MSNPFVVDTGVLIPLMNQGLFSKKFLELNDRASVWVSVVTINELVRGAHDDISKNIVDGFVEILKGRLLTPAKEQWLECASISEKILKTGKRSKNKVLLLQNDLLIALGARDIGATVVTCDQKDFKLIAQHIDVPIEFWQ